MATTAELDRSSWAPIAAIFDFTLKFEQVVLGIAPSASFTALAPFVFFYYSHEPLYVRWSLLLWLKLVSPSISTLPYLRWYGFIADKNYIKSAAAVLVGVQIANLAILAVLSQYRTDTTLPAAAFDLIAAMIIAGIAYIEHRHSVRSSTAFTIYLLIVALADIARSRSVSLRPGLTQLTGLHATAAVVKFSLIALQEVSKKPLLIDEEVRRRLGPEATGGALSRMLFLFLKPLFSTGFRTELLMGHLAPLDPEFAPRRLYEQFKPNWRPRQRMPLRRPNSLLKACLKTWRGPLAVVVFARLVAAALNFAQPFIINRVIEMVGKQHGGPNDRKERGGLLGAVAIVFIGIPIARTTAAHLMNRYVTRVRGGITAELFHKVHHLPESQARKKAAVTLMSADIDGIITGASGCLDIPIGTAEMAFGIYLLTKFIGLSAFVVFVPVAFTTIAVFFIGRRMATLFAEWNTKIEDRVAQTSQILPQLLAIKMLGLGKTIGSLLQRLRVEEINISKSYRRLEALSVGPILMADLMTPAVVITAAFFGSAFQKHLSATKVFPTLAIVSLIQRPLGVLLHAYPTARSMLACFSRIEDFLMLPEHRDSRMGADSVGTAESRRGSMLTPGSLVRFNHADIAPQGSNVPLLRGLNFQLPPGSTTALIANTGSGKSTIVDTILGQSEVLGGSVCVDSDEVAYCGQQVWLRDTTIRENIVGPLVYDEDKFNQVVQACFLEEDIRWLPGGVEYVVGTNGMNLSGGQRQRVGLARTAYAELRVVVLDDAFSSLDHDTAVCVLHQLCGRNGIFQRAGSTVIMVTYMPQCLDVANHLLLLDDEGKVTLNDTARAAPLIHHLVAALNEIHSSVPLAVEKKQQRSIRRSLEINGPSPDTTNTDIRQRGSFRLYMMFINPIGRFITFIYGLLVSVFSAGEVIPEVYLRVWIEVDPDESLFYIGYISVVMATCTVGSFVYWLLHTRLSPRSSISLHGKLVAATIGSTVTYLGSTKTGHLLNLYSQDMTLLSRNLPASFLRTIYTMVSATVQGGIIFSGATYLAAILPVILFVLYFVQRYYLRTSRQMRHLDLEMKAPLYTFFEETATGLKHIRAYRWEEANIERGLRHLEESQRPFYLMMAIQQWLTLVLGLLNAGLGILLVGLALFVPDSATETSIGLSFMSLLTFGWTLEVAMEAWTALETSSGALARVMAFETETPQEPHHVTSELPHIWPATGAIEMRHVFARYTSHVDRRPALQNINLSVAPGTRLGVVGRTGCGKSSLILTLLGFLQYDGHIEIDGIDISTISRDDLRSRLVTITQDSVQLNGTIRDNLLPFEMNRSQMRTPEEEEKAIKKDEELEELLKSLHIWVQLTDKGGLQAKLESVGYSKGQLQLLCVTRAILRQRETRSRVILVDEATSSLDAETEQTVNRIMRQYFRGCTIITVAHRRTSLSNVSGTIELHRGCIVEPGEAENLPTTSDEESNDSSS